MKLTTKKVGLILRKELGLIARRTGAGYELQLDRATRTRIHQLGLEWAILSLQAPQPGCELCEECSLGPSSSRQQSPDNTPAGSDSQPTDNVHFEHNVHEDDAEHKDDVHNVQHVQDIHNEPGLAAGIDNVQNVHDIHPGSALIPHQFGELPATNSSETIASDSSEQERAAGDASVASQ